MNIIFLDIDGVLVTHRSHACDVKAASLMRNFDECGIRMVRQLCIDFDAYIVITSTWRRFDEDTDIFRRVFARHGMLQYLYLPDWRTCKQDDKIRGYEIQDWIDYHPGCSNYVILDDDSKFLKHQKPFYVKTTMDDGISYNNYQRCRKILEGHNAK